MMNSDIFGPKLKIGVFVICDHFVEKRKCLAKVAQYRSGNPSCLVWEYRVADGVAHRGDNQFCIDVDSSVKILSNSCFTPTGTTHAFRVIKDISPLLGLHTDALPYVTHSRTTSVVDLTEDNAGDSCALMTPAVSATVLSSASRRRRRKLDSNRSSTGQSRSPHRAGDDNGMLCLSADSKQEPVAVSNSRVSSCGDAIICKRTGSEGSTSGSCSSGVSGGELLGANDTTKPANLSAQEQVDILSDIDDVRNTMGGVDGTVNGGVGVDGGDSSSEWESYDPLQWESAATGNHGEDDYSAEETGLVTTSKMVSTSHSSFSFVSKAIEQSAKRGAKRSKTEPDPDKGLPRRKFGSVAALRPPRSYASSTLSSSATASASSLLTLSAEMPTSLGVACNRRDKRQVASDSVSADGSEHRRSGRRSKTRSAMSMTETVQAEWDALMGDAVSRCSSVTMSVDGGSSIDEDEGASVTVDSEDSTSHKNKRLRKEPQKFSTNFTEIYENSQHLRKKELMYGSMRSERPPLPPAAASVGSRGRKGAGVGRGGAIDMSFSKNPYPGGAATAANNVVSKNKFVGVTGHGKRFKATIETSGKRVEVPGLFDSDVEAALARDEFGLSKFGPSFVPTFGLSESCVPPLYGYDCLDGQRNVDVRDKGVRIKTTGTALKSTSRGIKAASGKGKLSTTPSAIPATALVSTSSNWWLDKFVKKKIQQR